MLLNSPKKPQVTELENKTLQFAVLQREKDVETIKRTDIYCKFGSYFSALMF